MDTPSQVEMLRRLVIAWDADQMPEFLELIAEARRGLGMKLTADNSVKESMRRELFYKGRRYCVHGSRSIGSRCELCNPLQR